MKIAIASGKGGTGKTTLATSLASYLAFTHDVVLVDLDVEEPNSRLFIRGDQIHSREMFKLVPEWTGSCSLCGNCQDICNFNAVIKVGEQIMLFPELCHSCRACSELCPERALPLKSRKIGTLNRVETDNLDFVESRLEIGEQQAVPLIAQTKDYIDEHFDDGFIKIYDAPPGTSCPVVEAVRDVDYVILVTEPTPFGLYDLKLAVEVVRKLNRKFGVVLNRDGLGNDDVLEYCSQEQIPVIARIANDKQVARLYASGELIFDRIPQFKEQIQHLEKTLLEDAKMGAA